MSMFGSKPASILPANDAQRDTLRQITQELNSINPTSVSGAAASLMGAAQNASPASVTRATERITRALEALVHDPAQLAASMEKGIREFATKHPEIAGSAESLRILDLGKQVFGGKK